LGTTIEKLEEEKLVLVARMQRMEADLRLAIEKEKKASEMNQILELCKNALWESSSDDAVKTLEDEKHGLVARIQKLEADLKLAVKREKKAAEKMSEDAVDKLEDDKQGLVARIQKLEADLKLGVEREKKTSKNQVLEICTNVFCKPLADKVVQKFEVEKHGLLTRIQKLEADLKLSIEKEKETSEKMSKSNDSINKLEAEKQGLVTRNQKLEADLGLAFERERKASEKNQVLEFSRNVFCESSSNDAANKLEVEKQGLVDRIQKIETDMRLVVEREKQTSEKFQLLERQLFCKSSSDENSNFVGLHPQSSSDRDELQVEFC
jgi:hypothetical protein